MSPVGRRPRLGSEETDEWSAVVVLSVWRLEERESDLFFLYELFLSLRIQRAQELDYIADVGLRWICDERDCRKMGAWKGCRVAQ